tara:strand:- start:219 stop:629 length:411 start_codon:yes stop_codon:yes gene_type:complete
VARIKNKDKTLAREAFIKILYQHFISNNTIEMIRDNFIEKRVYDSDYLDNLCYLFINNNKEITNKLKLITKSSISSLTVIDRSILSLSIIELIHIGNLSKKIIINEAILLSKKYSSDDAYKFINKILDNMVKDENT